MAMRALPAILLLAATRIAAAALPLQPWLDAARPGSTISLPEGTYLGPATISKPVTLAGNGRVIIDAGGQGTVLTVRADDVTLRGLRLRNGGDSHDRLDAALMIEGKRLLVEDNDIDDVLFGVILHNTRNSEVRNNRIRSRHNDPADRGDGIRLWNSSYNRIVGNRIEHIRDITLSNAPYNRLVGNEIRDSRRAFNLLFASRSLIANNRLEHNATGIIALNSDGLIIRDNRVMHAREASGAGIALKETAAALVSGNEIIHCAHGIMADSPSHPINRIVFIGNLIAHNVTGIYFYGEKGGHIAIGNRFENNLWPVTVIGNGDPANDIWWNNTWDDYQGFDRDGDGIGDTPHELYAYADRIWMATPAAAFFRASPLLELLDFLERLAPFSHPELILRDPAPRFQPAR